MATSAEYRGCSTPLNAGSIFAIPHDTSTPRFDPGIRPEERLTGIVFPLDSCWLLDTHQGQDEEFYARTEHDRGPARTRRKYTEVPHVREAKIFLTSEEAKIFHDWYEWTLGVGQLRFIAQFHEIGVGLRWFEAEFNEPWNAEYVALGEANKDGNAERAWRISVAFRLYGKGMETNPALGTPRFITKFTLPLVSQNTTENVTNFTTSFQLPLTSLVSDVTLSTNFSAPLVSHVTPEHGLSSHFYVYLSATCSVPGKVRLRTSFKAPLT